MDSWGPLTFRSQEKEGSAMETKSRAKRTVFFFFLMKQTQASCYADENDLVRNLKKKEKRK